MTHFNWAPDHFADLARDRHAPALWIVDDAGGETQVSFAQIDARSARVANWLELLGVVRGDRVLLMLGNEVALWELMLACIKIGAVMIPATTLLSRDDLVDRFEHGRVPAVVTAAQHAATFDGLDGHAPGPGAARRGRHRSHGLDRLRRRRSCGRLAGLHRQVRGSAVPTPFSVATGWPDPSVEESFPKQV